jgi:hypothetical protein
MCWARWVRPVCPSRVPSKDTRARIESALDEIDEISECHGDHVRQCISPQKRVAICFWLATGHLPIFCVNDFPLENAAFGICPLAFSVPFMNISGATHRINRTMGNGRCSSTFRAAIIIILSRERRKMSQQAFDYDLLSLML